MKKVLSVALILLVASTFTLGLIYDNIDGYFFNDVIRILYASSLVLMIISLIAKQEGFGTIFFICSIIVPLTDVFYGLCAGFTFNDLMANADAEHYNLAFGMFGWKGYVIACVIVPLVLVFLAKVILPSRYVITKDLQRIPRENAIDTIH